MAAQYKYSKEDYYKLTNAPCIDVALALGMQINEKASDRKAWKIKNEQGLCIYREGNNWYRFSDGSHGFPIDLVTDKLHCSREQALDFIAQHVINGVFEQVQLDQKHASYSKPAPAERKFEVPAHDVKPSRVMAYLIKTRGIDPEIVKGMLQRKMIAEDSEHHNCLFFGRDEQGVIRSCALRGTTPQQFRGETAGGNKAYTFAMEGKNNVLRLFESPIDAMSHATFSKLLGKDWTADHRLSTNGCGSYDSIKKYLENHTDITSVWFAFDNDEGGRNGAAASQQKLLQDFPDRGLKIHISNPIRGKDWNEDLQLFRKEEQQGISAQQFVKAREPVFEYSGYHFKPVGYIPADYSLRDISQAIMPSSDMGFHEPYSHGSFGSKPILRCAETNTLFLADDSGLFHYDGEFVEQQPQQSDSEEDMEMG